MDNRKEHSFGETLERFSERTVNLENIESFNEDIENSISNAEDTISDLKKERRSKHEDLVQVKNRKSKVIEKMGEAQFTTGDRIAPRELSVLGSDLKNLTGVGKDEPGVNDRLQKWMRYLAELRRIKAEKNKKLFQQIDSKDVSLRHTEWLEERFSDELQHELDKRDERIEKLEGMVDELTEELESHEEDVDETVQAIRRDISNIVNKDMEVMRDVAETLTPLTETAISLHDEDLDGLGSVEDAAEDLQKDFDIGRGSENSVSEGHGEDSGERKESPSEAEDDGGESVDQGEPEVEDDTTPELMEDEGVQAVIGDEDEDEEDEGSEDEVEVGSVKDEDGLYDYSGSLKERKQTLDKMIEEIGEDELRDMSEYAIAQIVNCSRPTLFSNSKSISAVEEKFNEDYSMFPST